MCLRHRLPFRQRLLLSLGMLCLLSSLLLRRFSTALGFSDFWQGFCLGLGIVLTLASIVLNCTALRPPRPDEGSDGRRHSANSGTVPGTPNSNTISES